MYKDLMVQACLWSNLFYSTSYPFIHLYLMKGINERVFSINQFLTCIFIIIINSIWNKNSDKLYKAFPVFMITETVLYLALHIAMILGVGNAIMYYFIDTLLFGLVTKNMICGGNKMRSIAYKGEEREKYDNTIPIVSAITCLIGSSIAFIVEIPMPIAWLISWCGISVDNVFYFMAYKKYKVVNYKT